MCACSGLGEGSKHRVYANENHIASARVVQGPHILKSKNTVSLKVCDFKCWKIRPKRKQNSLRVPTEE